MSLFKSILCRNGLNKLIKIRRVLSTQIVLGIETSCDETGIAIVDTNGTIVSDVCRSQMLTHLWNGGVIPPVARTLHQRCIDQCVRLCLQKANMSPQELSAIAITVKPGLPLSLIIGKNYGKALALKYSKAVIPIDHMEAHALMATIRNESLEFPFVTLLISGGHCLLAIARDINKFEVLGQTIDIAPGDMIDKIARRLRLKNLGPPYDQICGGAALELCAKRGDPFKYFTNPDRYPLYNSRYRSCQLSFTGFQNMVFSLVRRMENELDIDPDRVVPEAHNICASIQFAVTFMLIKRLQRAVTYIRDFQLFGDKPIKLVISGGCAVNEFITNAIKKYCQTESVEVFIPPKNLCSDNGVMIAWNGVLKLINEHKYPDLILRDNKSIQDLDISGKEPFGEDISERLIKEHIKCQPINVKEFIELKN